MRAVRTQLFQLSPNKSSLKKPSTASDEFTSSVKAMGYWGSHNLYTQPGSFKEGFARTPSRGSLATPTRFGQPFGGPLARSGSSGRLAPLQGSMSSSSLHPIMVEPPM